MDLEDWSWPPPGLERLRGVLRTAARRGAFGTACVGLPLLWLITAPNLEDSDALAAVVTAALVVGIVAYLGGILRAAAALDLARRGARLGYSRALLVDVLADGGEDTPDLIAGTGAGAELRPRIRETMRRLRRVAAFTGLAGALLPLPLLCVGFWLALRGAAAPLSVWLLLVAPALLLWLATAVLRGYALLLAQWERGAAAWDPAPVSERERAEAWRRRFTPEQPERNGRPGGLLVLVAAAGAGVVAFVFLFLTVSLAGILAGWTNEPGYALVDLDAATAARIEAFRPLRVPADSTLSAAAAARAFHALIAAAGDTAPGMRTPEPHHPALWRDLPLPRTGYATLWGWLAGAETPPPAAALRDVPPHPALAELHLLARAGFLDPLAARWDSVPPAAIWYRDAGAAAHPAVLRPVADAANAWRGGDRDAARTILADLASAGLLLVDHARTAAELRLGAAMADAGAALLLRTGSDAEIAVRQRADSALGRALRRYGGTSAALRPRLAQRIGDDALNPALRWEALRLAYRDARCGSPGALLFSAPDREPPWLARARDTLVRTPGDSSAFAALVRRAAPLPGGSRWYRRIERGVRAVSGDHLLANPCFAAVVRGF